MHTDSPVFVVGIPRSGTTLLSAMLSAHPRIAIAPETHFLSKWRQEYDGVDVRQEQAFARFWRAWSQSEHFLSLRIDGEVARTRILSQGPHDYKQIFSTVLQLYAEKQGKPRWGEKTPAHERYIELLLGWFPHARVIYMLRDPRAVIASLLRVPWSHANVYLHARRWRRSAQRLGRCSSDARVRIVKYEDLVQDPRSSLAGLSAFLGEEFEPSMLDFADAAKPLVSQDAWKAQALQPVTTISIGKWREELSHRQAALIEHVAGKEMLRHGYVLYTGGLSRSERLRFQYDQVLYNLRRVRRLVRMGK